MIPATLFRGFLRAKGSVQVFFTFVTWNKLFWFLDPQSTGQLVEWQACFLVSESGKLRKTCRVHLSPVPQDCNFLGAGGQNQQFGACYGGHLSLQQGFAEVLLVCCFCINAQHCQMVVGAILDLYTKTMITPVVLSCIGPPWWAPGMQNFHGNPQAGQCRSTLQHCFGLFEFSWGVCICRVCVDPAQTGFYAAAIVIHSSGHGNELWQLDGADESTVSWLGCNMESCLVCTFRTGSWTPLEDDDATTDDATNGSAIRTSTRRTATC